MADTTAESCYRKNNAQKLYGVVPLAMLTNAVVRTAVLTGDVVQSTRLGTHAKSLPGRLEQAGELARELATGTSTPVDVFRGDAWQMAIRPPADAIAVAIRFRLSLRWFSGVPEVDTRVAIGIGEVDRLPSDRVSRGNGAAFRLSGRALDEMARGRRMAIRTDDAGLEGTLDAILGLLDTMVSGWSEAQAWAVDFALLGWNQKRIAKAWQPASISQQAVQKHLQRAGWPAVDRALRRCRELLS